jgi:predicted Fe-Mo cluster-binding NifX family protein/ferredoxin
VFVESEGLAFEAVENPNVSLGGGAGIQSGQLVSERGAQVVLTGNVGPNAFRTLEAAGIHVVTGATGTVRQAVEAYTAGGLAPTEGANVQSHFGMGATAPGAAPGFGPGGGGGMGGGMGRGGGMGGGRGMGRGGGGGRGMGRGVGRGGGMGRGGGIGGSMGVPAGPGMVGDAFGGGQPAVGPVPVTPGSQQEVEMLRAQADAMAGQLSEIRARIAEAERTAGGTLVAQVDASLCKACRQCVDTCPVGAITVDDAAHVDRSRCNGCARCIAVCPRSAISLHKA